MHCCDAHSAYRCRAKQHSTIAFIAKRCEPNPSRAVICLQRNCRCIIYRNREKNLFHCRQNTVHGSALFIINTAAAADKNLTPQLEAPTSLSEGTADQSLQSVSLSSLPFSVYSSIYAHYTHFLLRPPGGAYDVMTTPARCRLYYKILRESSAQFVTYRLQKQDQLRAKESRIQVLHSLALLKFTELFVCM